MVAPVVMAAGIGAAATLASHLSGAASARRAQERNAALQREFAQHGIRWRVEDAKAAGIHPLYALGASVSSPSPVYAGTDYSSLANAGQDISRAVAASQTEGERGDRLGDFINVQLGRQEARDRQRTLDERSTITWTQDYERRELENQLLRSRLAREASAQLGPPFPAGESVSGSGNAGGGSLVALPGGELVRVGPRSADAAGAVELKPSQVISRSSRDSSVQAGSKAAWELVEVTPGGSVKAVPTQNMAEAYEGQGLLGWWEAISDRFGRDAWLMGSGGSPPNIPVPRGYRWEWKPWQQRWVIVDDPRNRRKGQ